MDIRCIVVIFVHGLFGWGDDEDHQHLQKDYWNGIPEFIEQELKSRPDVQLKIIIPSLPQVDSIEVRGSILQQKINDALAGCPEGTRAHLIAHSRGGIDARWVIVQPEMADKIASLTTIGTAHRGTTFMNVAYQIVPMYRLIGKLLKLREGFKRRLGIRSSELYFHFLRGYACSAEQMRQAFYPLTHKGAAEFNAIYAERERCIRERSHNPLSYASYGGRVPHVRTSFLRPSHMILDWFGHRQERRSGNDGATSVWSTYFPWENEQPREGIQANTRTIHFDHYEQVNWHVPDDESADSLPIGLQVLYREILKDILSVQAP